MSTKPYKGFEPKWMLQRAPENSYRSIFRWGDPDFFKYPKESLYKYVKKRCNLKDEEFMQYNDDLGLDPVNLGEEHAPKIDKKHVKAIAAIVGEKNVSQSDYDRLAVSYGQTMYDLLRMRHRRFDSLPDLVVFPETSEQIEKIVAYVTKNKIPLYVYGGGSSVTRGVEPINGGVSLDMRRNFNKVIKPLQFRQVCPDQSSSKRFKTLRAFSAQNVRTPAVTSRSRLNIPPSAVGPSHAVPVRTAPITAP